MKNKFIFLTFVMVCVLAVFLCASADFSDDFSQKDPASNGWESRLLFGMPDLDYIFPSDDRISFHMPNYNTAIYLINPKTQASDSTVEVTFENVFSSLAEFGLICRSNEAGWYEFRVILTGYNAGGYAVYRYDKALREEGKNPFVSLHPKTDLFYTEDIKLGFNAQNTLKMTCEGDEIRIFINGKEQAPLWNSRFYAREYQEGTSGFSVWSQKTKYGVARIDVLNFRSVFDE